MLLMLFINVINVISVLLGKPVVELTRGLFVTTTTIDPPLRAVTDATIDSLLQH